MDLKAVWNDAPEVVSSRLYLLFPGRERERAMDLYLRWLLLGMDVKRLPWCHAKLVRSGLHVF